MLVGLLLLALIAFIGAFGYKQSRLEQRVIKNISLVDWINILLVPLFGYVGAVLVVTNILSRPNADIFGLNDIGLFIVGMPFFIYAFVGNSIHVVSKAISRHMKENPRSLSYRVTELFHGKFSHYISWVCLFLAFFVIVLLEINHPLTSALSTDVTWVIAFAAILVGVSMARTFFYTSDYWGGNRSMYIFIGALFIAVSGLFSSFHLSYSYYPTGLFLAMMVGTMLILFILRRVFVVFRLTQKRRLRFLVRLVWLKF